RTVFGSSGACLRQDQSRADVRPAVLRASPASRHRGCARARAERPRRSAHARARDGRERKHQHGRLPAHRGRCHEARRAGAVAVSTNDTATFLSQRSIMSAKSLEDLLQASGGPLKLLRNSQTGPNPYPGVNSEYTNWRDEQRAWQETAVLFNQSYHMTDM